MLFTKDALLCHFLPYTLFPCLFSVLAMAFFTGTETRREVK